MGLRADARRGARRGRRPAVRPRGGRRGRTDERRQCRVCDAPGAMEDAYGSARGFGIATAGWTGQDATAGSAKPLGAPSRKADVCPETGCSALRRTVSRRACPNAVHHARQAEVRWADGLWLVSGDVHDLLCRPWWRAGESLCASATWHSGTRSRSSAAACARRSWDRVRSLGPPRATSHRGLGHVNLPNSSGAPRERLRIIEGRARSAAGSFSRRRSLPPAGRCGAPGRSRRACACRRRLPRPGVR